MATYISEETGQVTTIRCRWADQPTRGCSEDATAIALRGQWEGGDADVDPHWIPVCAGHDARWNTNCDTGEDLPVRYRLPRFQLNGSGRTPHEHEQWQIESTPDGGRYCRAGRDRVKEMPHGE